MKMKIAFHDGSWLVGEREWYYLFGETKGTHHFLVLAGSAEFRPLIGIKVAVPISSAKYFILDYKGGW